MVKLRRIKSEEGGNVYRWYEGKNGIIASVVSGNFPNEAELRVSGKKFDSFKSQGSKELMLRNSDKEIKRRINMLINRRNLF